LTTVVTDAASRQYSNDSARDITKAVELNGTNNLTATKDSFSTLLGTAERIAGENRIQTLTASGQTQNLLTDVRHSILNDVNRSANEVLTAGTQNFNVLNKSINDSAWEQRTASATGFAHIGEEHLRAKHDIIKTATDSYGSLLLEQQKLKQYLSTKVDDKFASAELEQQKISQFLASKSDNHFAMNQLEQQKISQYLSKNIDDKFASAELEQQKISQFLASKADGHFAMNQLETQKVKESVMTQSANQFAINQLEMQKVKEGLACQAAQNHASAQLEAQKIKEHLSSQLADAKYEQLKSQQFLADKLCECCCEIKEKVETVNSKADLIDRDRLRDNLTVSRDESNMLKLNEYNQLYWGRGGGDRGFGGGWGGRGGRDWDGPGNYGGSYGYGPGNGNVYNNFDGREFDHHHRRGGTGGNGGGDHHH